VDLDELRNSIEEEKSSGDNPRRQSRVNWVNSISALLLAVGLTFFLFSQYEMYKARERGLNVQLAQLMKQVRLLEERLDKDGRRIGLLVTDLETVQKRVGVTRDEIRRSRAVAEEIRQQQQQDVQLLTRQLVRKADFQQVKDLGAKADTKFKEVDKQITGVQREVQASRQELEKTWRELSARGLRLTEQGELIATSSEALEELRRRRGDRDYF
jgi:chromosome segregation ATPase